MAIPSLSPSFFLWILIRLLVFTSIGLNTRLKNKLRVLERLGRKNQRLIIVLLLFAPSLWFAGDYVSSSLLNSTEIRQFRWSSYDEGWSINMKVSHSPYLISGQRVPVNLDLGLRLSYPYVAAHVDLIGIEIRDASKINSTTNIVEEWRTLSWTHATIGANYTTSAELSKRLDVLATYPPTDSLFDAFITSKKMAVNGVAVVTVYWVKEDGTYGDYRTLSLLDEQILYAPQLSTIRSSSSWIVYQLVSTTLVSLIYVRSRSASLNPADRTYAWQLESHRLRKNLENLEELMRNGKINEGKYTELKRNYERELEQLEKTITKAES